MVPLTVPLSNTPTWCVCISVADFIFNSTKVESNVKLRTEMYNSFTCQQALGGTGALFTWTYVSFLWQSTNSTGPYPAFSKNILLFKPFTAQLYKLFIDRITAQTCPNLEHDPMCNIKNKLLSREILKHRHYLTAIETYYHTIDHIYAFVHFTILSNHLLSWGPEGGVITSLPHVHYGGV